MRGRLALCALIVLLVSPASAGVAEFSQSQHDGNINIEGQLAAVALHTDQGIPTQNALILEADELVIRSYKSNYFVDLGDGGVVATAPETQTMTFHNANLRAVPNDGKTATNVYPINEGAIVFSTDSATSRPTASQTHPEYTATIPEEERRIAEVSDSIEIHSKDRVEATIEGGVSVNLWGWSVRITADEGTYEYETGPSPEYETDQASVGSATQMRVESNNATVDLSGTFNDVHRVWIRDAVVESDRLDLKLTDESLPTDQAVFTSRSSMTVLAVTDESVVADITETPPAPILPDSNAAPTPASEPAGANATGPLLGVDGGDAAPFTTMESPDTGLPGWVVAAIIMACLAAVFFAVRQTRGWPTHAFFVRRAEALHDMGRFRLVAHLSTVGHWLEPQDARHRFHRGLARQERRDREGALADLAWASSHLSNHEEQAVSAYYAAYVAARTGRMGIAGDMLARAACVDEQFLWDAQEDPGLRSLAGKPDFEAGLAKGMG